MHACSNSFFVFCSPFLPLAMRVLESRDQISLSRYNRCRSIASVERCRLTIWKTFPGFQVFINHQFVCLCGHRKNKSQTLFWLRIPPFVFKFSHSLIFSFLLTLFFFLEKNWRRSCLEIVCSSKVVPTWLHLTVSRRFFKFIYIWYLFFSPIRAWGSRETRQR